MDIDGDLLQTGGLNLIGGIVRAVVKFNLRMAFFGLMMAIVIGAMSGMALESPDQVEPTFDEVRSNITLDETATQDECPGDSVRCDLSESVPDSMQTTTPGEDWLRDNVILPWIRGYVYTVIDAAELATYAAVSVRPLLPTAVYGVLMQVIGYGTIIGMVGMELTRLLRL